MAGVVYFRSWCGIISFIILVYYFILHYSKVEKNRCEMTYMFEYPQYIKQNLPKDVTEKFSQYQLYLYGEGKYADKLRHEKLQGFPVLFVPGNAGSHRQVRSFASVALRMSQSLQSSFHFNFFSVDFNEELSALFGISLWNQTAFLKECISYIMNLYSDRRQMQKIIIIAHSMGGMIAKGLFSIPDFDLTTVSMIFNLATPQRAPVIELDWHISNFYDTVNRIWEARRATDLKMIAVVNIGGGERDILVRSDLTQDESDNQLDINALTTAIPKVWLSTDHLCILWCKSLVLVVGRTIFDFVNLVYPLEIPNENLMNKILQHYFKRNLNSLPFKVVLPHVPFFFAYNCEWLIKEEVSWRYTKKKLLETTYLMVPLVDGEHIVVLAAGLERDDWIAACHKRENVTACDKGESLSEQGSLVPENKLMILSPTKEIIRRGYTHIAIHLAPSSKLSSRQSVVNIVAERYEPNVRHRIVTLPNLLQSLVSTTPHQLLSVPITEGSVFYNLSLKGLTDIWQAYVITVETKVCRHSESGDGIAKFFVPWGTEDNYFTLRPQGGSKVLIPGRLYLPKPHLSTAMAQLLLFLSPECSYSISVHVQLSLLFFHFVQFYGTMILSYVAALLLIALSAQIRILAKKGSCLPILPALSVYPTFVVLALLPELLQLISSAGFAMPFPKLDGNILQERQHYFFLLRTFLYLVAYGVVALLVFSSSCVFYILGSVAMWIRSRICGKKVVQAIQQEHLSLPLAAEFCIFSACLLFLPGAVMLCVTLFFLIFQIAFLHGSNRIEEDRRGSSISSSRRHLQQTFFLLQLVVCAIFSPALSSWGRNVHISLRLYNDPHIWPAVVIMISGSVLWQRCIPCKTQVHPKAVSCIILLIAVIATTHCLLSIWRIGFLVSASFAVVAAQQVASMKRDIKQD